MSLPIKLMVITAIFIAYHFFSIDASYPIDTAMSNRGVTLHDKKSDLITLSAEANDLSSIINLQKIIKK